MNLLYKIQRAFGTIDIVVNGQILSKHSRHLVTLAQTAGIDTFCNYLPYLST